MGIGDSPIKFSQTSYLGPAERRHVDRLLGDSYDPTKPLNIQLFKARWAAASPAERRTIAKNLSNQFVEGVNPKSLAAFHNTYLDALNSENEMLQRSYDEALGSYSQNGGGFAISKEQAQANLAYWKAFAASPEGQAHIAETGMTQEDWLKTTLGDIKEGVQNYQQQQKQFGNIQNLAARLGINVPGFVAPGWSSTLEGIRTGQGPMPSADYLAMYPGSAKDLVGVESTYKAGNSKPQGGSNTNTTSSGEGFQPFTNFTGTQYPDTFSERDLYQETQSL